jgi:uncharacterized protein YjbI with pentapeptide repeats
MAGPAVQRRSMTKQSARNQFGKLLRQYREDANLSQNVLARGAGLDPTSLNRIENARGGRPRLSTINRLCRALGWSVSHPNAELLRQAAGYKPSDGDGPATDSDELRRIVMVSVAEFNRWRETHDDDSQRLDWSNADFRSQSLRAVDFHRLMLPKANFENADLVRANLREANLAGANLRLADLRGANLREAILSDADLSGADLRGAYLHAANLKGAVLNNADFRGADLRQSVLRDANMRKADFRRADLSSADLTRAELVDTNLTKADLHDAILHEADLRRAQFRRREVEAEADTRRAKFRTERDESEAVDDHIPWNGD